MRFWRISPNQGSIGTSMVLKGSDTNLFLIWVDVEIRDLSTDDIVESLHILYFVFLLQNEEKVRGVHVSEFDCINLCNRFAKYMSVWF